MTNPFEQIDARLTNIESLLLDLKHGEIKATKTPAVDPEDIILTTDQAAEFLGIAIQTLYGKIQRKELPIHKPLGCKRVYFYKRDLIEFVRSGRVKSRSEVENESIELNMGGRRLVRKKL